MKFNPFRNVRPVAALAAAAFLCAGTAFAGDDGTISAGKLAKDAKKFYNQTVTVKAEEEDVFDGHTFTLDEDALLAGGDVLVILSEKRPITLKKDDVVMVTGIVRPYVVADLERDFDFFERGKIVSTGTKVEYETRPVLIATSVKTAAGNELFAGKYHAAMTPGMTTKPATMKTISAGKLAKDATKFYGQTVTVKSEVEDVLDAHSLTLDEDALLAGHDVLVLLPEGRATDLKKDDVVTVTGTVRQFVVADLERDFDFFKDGKIMKSEKKVDYETRPVLVATSVRTADGRELLTPPAARIKQ
jgi:hypothetical protein